MLKILFINSSPFYGGTEKWAITTATILQKKGHHIWFAYRFHNIHQHAIDQGLTTIYFPLRNDIDFRSVIKLRKFIVQNSIDTVIATKVREYWLGGWAAKLTATPFIIRLGIHRKLKKSIKNKLIYRYIMTAMIVNTHSIKETLLENDLIDPKRIHVIYNGIDCPNSLEQMSKKNNDINLIYVGSLTRRKNVRTIVQIFYKLQKQIELNNIHLWLVGEGPEKDKLQKYVNELDIKKRVRFWGHRDDIPDILQQADIMLVLSQSEGFPNAAMEAMAFGVPLVISKLDGVEEFVSHGNTAFIVDPANEENIIQILKVLIKDPEIHQKIRTNAFQHMTTNFSLSYMTERIEHMLRSVLNG